MAQLFLCTDLDRTLLPNGAAPESPQARVLFARLAGMAQVTLAYVSGRDQGLVDEAISDYGLPQPDFAITDVGTRILCHESGRWQLWSEWSDDIGVSWGLHDHAALSRLFSDLEPLQLQEIAKQNTHKLSYYLPLTADRNALQDEMQQRLKQNDVRASLVWSVDDNVGVGLLDVLPARANKLHAVNFIREHLGFAPGETLFAGDSGNDLAVMASNIPAVLVANAVDAVRHEAIQMASEAGNEHTLYLAQGGFLGMNGNYSAGILEGVAHFYPDIAALLATELTT